MSLLRVFDLMEDRPIQGEFDWLRGLPDDSFREFVAAGNAPVDVPKEIHVSAWPLFGLSLLGAPFTVLIGFLQHAPPAMLFSVGLWSLIGAVTYIWITGRAKRARLWWAIHAEQLRRSS